ncbi:MAG: hypothetical protein ABIG46_06515 [Candidatus Omnitrophota bacterium]|nr:hypothetical protein [Candidatus Omnitrophota bacterium]
MPDKMKFVVIGLAVILVVSLALNLFLVNTKTLLEEENAKLFEQKNISDKKLDDASRRGKQLEDRVSSLTRDLDRMTMEMDRFSKEKIDYQRKLEAVNKDKELLTARLKELSVSARSTQEQPLIRETGSRSSAAPTDDIYWAGILKQKTNLEFQLDNARSELKNIKLENEKLLREKVSLDLDIKSINRQSEDLKRQMEYNQKITDAITQELVREKEDKFRIQSEVKGIKAENSAIRRQLNGITARKVALEAKLVEIEGKNKDLEEGLGKMENFVKEKMLQMDQLRYDVEKNTNLSEGISEAFAGHQSVQLPPIVVRPQARQAVAETPNTDPQVISVNKENNFVIINLGEKQGVKTGELFEVYRNGQSIGVLEVIKTREEISACDIKSESVAIDVGDKIK